MPLTRRARRRRSASGAPSRATAGPGSSPSSGNARAAARAVDRSRQAEHAGGHEVGPPMRVSPIGPVGVLRAPNEIHGSSKVELAAPVERRVGVEDVEAAHQQDRQADDVDPVHHAHRQAVPVEAARRRAERRGRRCGAVAAMSMRSGSPGCADGSSVAVGDARSRLTAGCAVTAHALSWHGDSSARPARASAPGARRSR